MFFNDILVSIIIPAYNTRDYIKVCLESILNQSYENLEVIIIDDGSKDDLYKIVNNYANSDNRIKLIRQNNRGASGARNHGLEVAKGDFIFFLDSDDWIESCTIELLVKKAIEDNSEIVMPDRYTKVNLDGTKNEELLFVNYNNYKTVADFVVNIIIGEARGWRVSSVLYKTSIIKDNKVEFPEGHTAEDVIFNLDFLSKVNKISFLAYPTLNVNKRIDSVTSTYQNNFIDTLFLIDKKAKEYIEEVKHDKTYGNIAVNSLLCRNIILLIGSEMSSKNKKRFFKKVKIVYSNFNIPRVKEAFNQKEFIRPYFNSNIKVYYVVIMRVLIKYKLKSISIVLSILANKA